MLPAPQTNLQPLSLFRDDAPVESSGILPARLQPQGRLYL